MSFNGCLFIFNNIVSEKFGLTITNANSGEVDSPLIQGTEFIFKKTAHSNKFHHLGTTQNSQLTFQFEFFSERKLYAYDREQIALWLSGDGKLRELRIIQDDMSSVYYNCYFFSLDWVSVSNSGYGFKGTVVCDSTFAWGNPVVKKVQNKPTGVVGGKNEYPEKTKITIYNSSTDYRPIMPDLIVTLGDNNNTFKITNESNANEYFEFKNLQNGEKISIKNNLIMASITNPNKVIVDNFYGDFLELVRGNNKLLIDGQIKEIEIKYQPSKNIGG